MIKQTSLNENCEKSECIMVRFLSPSVYLHNLRIREY